MGEQVQVLTSLGLTQVQSKVFWALSTLRCATISGISKVSMVPRQDIYRVVDQLQELSLVRKVLTKPVRFQSVAMEEACTILLRRKKEEYVKLKRLQRNLLESFNNSQSRPLEEQQEYRLLLVKGKEAILKSIKENFNSSEKHVSIVTTPRRFLQSLNSLGYIYKKKLQEGVTYRVITEKPSDEQAFFIRAAEILTYSNFELKYFIKPIKAIVMISDERTALAPMETDGDLFKSPLLCTNNSAFLAMFMEYFANVWNDGVSY